MSTFLELDCRDKWAPPLHQAVKANDKTLILNLIEQGVDINGCDCCGQTPLHWAAQYGLQDIIELLIQNGSFVNAIDKNGRTALYFSVKNNHIKSVHSLILAKADVNGTNYNNESSLYIASLYSRKEIIEILLKANADVHFISQVHEIIYHAVARNQNEGCVSLFLNKGMNINERRDNGWTPLHDAVWQSNKENVLALIDAGAFVNLKEEPRWLGNQQTGGWMPLHLAAWKNDTEIALLLVNAGADINGLDNHGGTPFKVAYQLRYWKFCITMLRLKFNLIFNKKRC